MWGGAAGSRTFDSSFLCVRSCGVVTTTGDKRVKVRVLPLWTRRSPVRALCRWDVGRHRLVAAAETVSTGYLLTLISAWSPLVWRTHTLISFHPAMEQSSLLHAGVHRAEQSATAAAARPPRPELADVAGCVLQSYGVDASSVLALSREYVAREDLLRAAVAREGAGAPSRLIASVRGRGSAGRVARLLAATRPGVLNGARSRGKSALHWCVKLLRLDLVSLLLASPALEAWGEDDGEEGDEVQAPGPHTAFAMACKIASDMSSSDEHRRVGAECALAICRSPLHPGDLSLSTPPHPRLILHWGGRGTIPDCTLGRCFRSTTCRRSTYAGG